MPAEATDGGGEKADPGSRSLGGAPDDIPGGTSGDTPGGTFDADAYLNSLVPIGWKLGLERMNLLCDELGRPQDRFRPVHVVGTNGKSSVARMMMAIAEAHGVRAGCSLSPHLTRWSERVVVAGKEVDPDLFTDAVARAAAAAEKVNSGLGQGEVVTQFELATAAAFIALAESGVALGVIEAGLGGRLDATNSINSEVTVLTSIGLDHTEFLGETELEVAAEKLAVLRPGTVLVAGELSADVDRLAVDTAAARGCRLVRVSGELPAPSDPGLAVAGTFQRRNFAVAQAATEVLLGPLDPEATARAARAVVIPGRLERMGEDPPTFVDVAHNRQGAAALAASLPGIAGTGPVIACIAVLADKDASGMLAELAGVLDHAVFTELPEGSLKAWGRPGAHARPAADLLESARGLGLEGEVITDPVRAVERARTLARDRNGTVIIAGSHFLLSRQDPGSPPEMGPTA